MNIKIIGIDLAKEIFQVCALNQAGKVLYNKKLKREKFILYLHQLEPGMTVAMEACGSANHWARLIVTLGHTPKLIPAQHVKPFVKGNKNDANDALAICEAAQRPNMNVVPIKTVEQQDIQMLHRIRQRHVQTKVAIVNQIRAFLREYGLIMPLTIHAFHRELPDILEDADNALTALARQLIRELYRELKSKEAAIEVLNEQVKGFIKNNDSCQRLLAIPGYGPMIVTALFAAVGDGKQFTKGRQMAAWSGLTPRHVASGGKVTHLETTKMGNAYLRYLLVHGARTVVTWAKNKTDRLSRWIQQLIERRGKHKTIVALANKCARMAWAVLAKHETFQPYKMT